MRAARFRAEDLDRPGRVAAPPRARAGSSEGTGRGAAAGASWIVRGRAAATTWIIFDSHRCNDFKDTECPTTAPAMAPEEDNEATVTN